MNVSVETLIISFTIDKALEGILVIVGVVCPDFSESDVLSSGTRANNWQLVDDLAHKVKTGISEKPFLDDWEHSPLLLRGHLSFVILLLSGLVAHILDELGHLNSVNIEGVSALLNLILFLLDLLTLSIVLFVV